MDTRTTLAAVLATVLDIQPRASEFVADAVLARLWLQGYAVLPQDDEDTGDIAA